jgi:hypothetical protein
LAQPVDFVTARRWQIGCLTSKNCQRDNAAETDRLSGASWSKIALLILGKAIQAQRLTVTKASENGERI